LLALAAALALPGAAASASDEFLLAPQLDVLVLDRELLAVDARSGGQTSERLELGERVLFAKQRGRVGVAVTDRRMLAVASSSGAWQEARYRRNEPAPLDASLGDRVALLLTPVRAIGFDGKSGNLIERSIGPQEVVLESAVGQNVAAVVTNRRALGMSSNRGGFFEAPIRVNEQVQRLSALADTVTVHTSKRLLIFRGPTGSWEERRLPIR
jgi:hypothetical protein